MKKSLLIVESPTKARTLTRYLGKGFSVIASMGHIKDLPEKQLGVDIRNGFRPRYIYIPGKKQIIKKIKEESSKAEEIYIATDPDREGEAIAQHISEIIPNDNRSIYRVLFNEITSESVKEGIARPGVINQNLVIAQQARRVMDRLVGYQVSPFLWKVLYSGLSAGRVQTVALRIICERQEEIEKFVPEEYWSIKALLQTPSKEEFLANLVKIDGKKARIRNQEEANSILQELEKLPYHVSKLEEKKVFRAPQPPFTTSTLQQEASHRLRFSPQKTMRVAQQLYEGVEVGGESVGLITYMRTDSTRIAEVASNAAREFIKMVFGDAYLPARRREYRTKKRIQDAHEAIRPTRLELDPEKIKDNLTRDQYRLYRLIWRRFLASQMASACYLQRQIDVQAGERFLFRATGNQLLFKGYKVIYDTEEEEPGTKIPEKIQSGEQLKLQKLVPEQHFTQPPAPYSESTLIKALDKFGIGRPSTYATIVSTLYSRKYVVKEKNYLHPTELGRTVNSILIQGMPEIFNVQFTAEMESHLDQIESGEVSYQTVLEEFYRSFRASLDKMDEHRKEIREQLSETTGEICEKCGAPMVIKWGKNGRFLACSAFPACKNTKPLPENESNETLEETCPECGAILVIKKGRYGRFKACSRYPDCKYTSPLDLGVNCPEENCDGKILEKYTKKGKVFYSCSNYPECKFALWNKPINLECPHCHYPLLVEKKNRNGTVHYQCPSCKQNIKTKKGTDEPE